MMPVFTTCDLALENVGVRATLVDAQAAGYVADGYARATGNASLVVTQYFTEALMAAPALANGWSDRVPMAIITVAPKGDHQTLRSIYDTFCYSTTSADLKQYVPEMQLRGSLSKPIHLMTDDIHEVKALASDLTALFTTVVEEEPVDALSDYTDVQEVAQRLVTAKRPVLVLGKGAVDALEVDALKQLIAVCPSP